MKKVLIATPSYDGRLDVWYTNALLRTVVLGLQNDVEFIPVFMSYDALIQRSRNDLVGIAVENSFDGVLWIDSDMEWQPEWALEAVKSGKDVLGLPVVKKAIEEQYNVKIDPKDLTPDEEGFIEVESVGTGFLYWSKAALDHLWDNSEAYVHNGQDRRWVFEVKIQNGDIISEDVLACQKLRDGGFKVFIDSTKTCNHIGTLKFTGDFANFAAIVRAANEEN